MSPIPLPPIRVLVVDDETAVLDVYRKILSTAVPSVERAARQYGMRLIGPNCLGVMMPGAATDPGIALAPVRAFAEPPAIDDAAELLAAAPLHSIAYGFFSSSYVLGADGGRAASPSSFPVWRPCARCGRWACAGSPSSIRHGSRPN